MDIDEFTRDGLGEEEEDEDDEDLGEEGGDAKDGARGGIAPSQADSLGTRRMDSESLAEISSFPYPRGQSSEPLDMNKVQGPLPEWLENEAVREQTTMKFLTVLQNHTEDDVPYYENVARQMVNSGSCSLNVCFEHLGRYYDQILALWVADAPTQTLQIFDDAATHFVSRMFPDFEKIVHSPKIRVRITELPICDNIRDLRKSNLNNLVKVSGVVTRRTQIYPSVSELYITCLRCYYSNGPFIHLANKDFRLEECSRCQQKGPFKPDQRRTVYRDFQKLSIQEAPSQVPAGRLPRPLEVILMDDLKDVVKPGDEIEVTGVYRTNYDVLLNHKLGFPVFSTFLEANYISLRDHTEKGKALTAADLKAVMELSKLPDLKEKMIESIAPSIHGHADTKLGIALSLFGGVVKKVGDHRVRGDINVLLLGDPGTAKSQLLKYCEKTAPRAVYTTGRGSTAVGLTAAVVSDPNTGDWALEGGAMVLADQGMCLIDEFDKMNENDRVSIHEAMEQQTISIAKAGIVTSLQARCAVVAAANPIGGRYDESETFEKNVRMTQPILSRFDLLYVIKDEVDAVKDYELAKFVCFNHLHNHPAVIKERADSEYIPQENETVQALPPVSQELLRKYIIHAKKNCNPMCTEVDTNQISEVFVTLRQCNSAGGAAITVRHLESVIRLAEAHAKLHLRSIVRQDDVDAAIGLFLRCFIETQKVAMKRELQKRFSKFLRVSGTHNAFLAYMLSSKLSEALQYLLAKRTENPDPYITRADFEQAAKEYQIYSEEITKFINSSDFSRKFVYSETGQIRLRN